MKSFTHLKKAMAFLQVVLFISMTSHSQNASIGCDAKFFVSYGSENSYGSSTTLHQLSITAGVVSGVPFATNPSGIGFNAMGLNPIDGYIYALRYPDNNDRVSLVRIGSGTPNNVVDLGEIHSATNLDNEDYSYAGCFDAAGTFYFITTDHHLYSLANAELGSGGSQRDPVFIGTATPSNSGDYYADIAINPVDGQMYGVTIGDDYGVYSINKTNGNDTRLGSYPTGSSMIGLFFTEEGNMYGYRNNGAFYLLSKVDGSGAAAGTGLSYTYADGCSCSFGRVYHDLTSQKGICPGLGGIYNPEWDITVSVTNQSPNQKTGLTYTLLIPSNRFSIIQNQATLLTNLKAIGLLPGSATAANIVVSNQGVLPGTVMNKIVITGFQTGGPATTLNFTLKLKLVTLGGVYTSVPLQSAITGLPANIGTSDNSNDPTTVTPDDPTIVSFCPNIVLPAKLLSFNGSYKNNMTLLNWLAENQVDLSLYEIERSENGINFNSIGIKAVQGSGSGRQQYQYFDDLTAISGNVFYYRLKMLDVDAQYKYSNVIMIRRDQKELIGISISPNPVKRTDMAILRMTSSAKGIIDLKVIDMSGRVMLQQQNHISDGSNSIAINNLDRLQAGTYIVQVHTEQEVMSTKLLIAH